MVIKTVLISSSLPAVERIEKKGLIFLKKSLDIRKKPVVVTKSQGRLPVKFQ